MNILTRWEIAGTLRRLDDQKYQDGEWNGFEQHPAGPAPIWRQTHDHLPAPSPAYILRAWRKINKKQTKTKWVLLCDMLLGAKSVCDTSQAWPWLFADRLAFFYGALDPTSRLGTRRKTDNVYDAQLEINARSGWKQETKIDTPKGWKRGYRCDSFDSVQFVPELTSHSREVCCRARVVHENPRKKAELPFILLLGVSFFNCVCVDINNVYLRLEGGCTFKWLERNKSMKVAD